MKRIAIWTFAYLFGVFALSSVLVLHLEAEPAEARTLPTFAELLRDKVAWPCGVELIREQKVMVYDGRLPMGFVVINAGVRVKATALSRDGVVTAEIAGQSFTVPVEETSLIELFKISDDVRRLLKSSSNPPEPRRVRL